MRDLTDSTGAIHQLELTAAEMKVTHAALRSFLLDFGHDERDVHDIIRRVLAKLPQDGASRPIDLGTAGGVRSP